MPTDSYSEPESTPSLKISHEPLFMSGAELAQRYGVGVKWINERKLHLGATPLSDSANSKLRYHVPTADAYMHSRMLKPVAKRRRQPAKRRASANGQGLIEFV
jgi:hypothetical protein